jgi:outer membrane immunogenic protein
MKRILLAAIAAGALALGTPAIAADLPVKAPSVAPPGYDWSGFYFGGLAGYGFGNQNLNNALGPAGFANFTTNWETHGPMAGGEAGYNWMIGNILLGIEGDGLWTNIQGQDNFALSDINGLPMNDANKLNWVASLRVRSGIAVDHLLLFFDAGWADGKITHTNTVPGGTTDTFSATRSGLAAGGGVAFAITDNIIGKIEYRYIDLGAYHRDTPANTAMPYNVANTYSTVLLGLDFKFGGGSRVAAKY